MVKRAAKLVVTSECTLMCSLPVRRRMLLCVWITMVRRRCVCAQIRALRIITREIW